MDLLVQGVEDWRQSSLDFGHQNHDDGDDRHSGIVMMQNCLLVRKERILMMDVVVWQFGMLYLLIIRNVRRQCLLLVFLVRVV